MQYCNSSLAVCTIIANGLKCTDICKLQTSINQVEEEKFMEAQGCLVEQNIGLAKFQGGKG